MCFVSLAHPSAPLVAALLAAGDMSGTSGARVIDAYIIGFEIEARLGRVMNPRHYQRGWHCTSTLGAIGSAAAVARLLSLDQSAVAHALAIAASEASGLKENFGTMVKPLHAGLAARDGVLAALLAQGGLTASDRALDGPQGFLRAMDTDARRSARFAEPRAVHGGRRGARGRRGRRHHPDSVDLRQADVRPRGEVQHAVLRGRRNCRRARRRRHLRCVSR
jgi:2-methylcitrate dehydratase PrpD